ncbi:MAG: hypothetical protein AAGG99_07740 [Pseudomonadota bacterium]
MTRHNKTALTLILAATTLALPAAAHAQATTGTAPGTPATPTPTPRFAVEADFPRRPISALIGTTVFDENNEDAGRIDSVVETGTQVFVILRAQGRRVALAPEKFSMRANRIKMETVGLDDLRTLPEFDDAGSRPLAMDASIAKATAN